MNPNIKVFLDSGAHSLYTEHVINKQKERKDVSTLDFSFYDSEEFWTYVDNYAEYVKKNVDLLELYVNIDVIFNAEGTLKVQKYLEEKHHLNPLPVFHPKEDFKYLKHYIDNYEYIGIGGLGQDMSKKDYISFGDKVFSMIGKKNTHGFAMTSLPLMNRYPWYSVDSSSWVQFSRYGLIIIPKTRKNKYVFNEIPWIVTMSERSPRRNEQNKHYQTSSKIEKRYFKEYIESLGFKVGSSVMNNGKEEIIEPGVCNDGSQRDFINMLFYLEAGKQMDLNLFFAGNFPQMLNYDREVEVSGKVIEIDGTYRRLISYWFENNSENILCLKKGERPDAKITKRNSVNTVPKESPRISFEEGFARLSRKRGHRANDSFHFHR